MDERRTGWVLIVVLVVQLVFLAAQGSREGDTVLEDWACASSARRPARWRACRNSFAGFREGLRTRERLQEENAGCVARSKISSCA